MLSQDDLNLTADTDSSLTLHLLVLYNIAPGALSHGSGPDPG